MWACQYTHEACVKKKDLKKYWYMTYLWFEHSFLYEDDFKQLLQAYEQLYDNKQVRGVKRNTDLM